MISHWLAEGSTIKDQNDNYDSLEVPDQIRVITVYRTLCVSYSVGRALFLVY